MNKLPFEYRKYYTRVYHESSIQWTQGYDLVMYNKINKKRFHQGTDILE